MNRWSWLLVLAAVLIAPMAAAHAAAPPGPRLGFIRLIDRRESIPGSLDVLTVGQGGGARQLVTGTSHQGGVAPMTGFAWSPDGQMLAVGGLRGTDFEHLLDTDELDLFLAAADGSGLRAVPNLQDIDGEPSDDAVGPLFSADGTTLYFSRLGLLPNGGGLASLKSSIWAVGVDGSGLRQLTPDRGLVFDIPASVSAAGDELAFTRFRCKAGSCWSSARALSLVTGAERLIAKRASDPVYSPDGTSIALARYRTHTGGISVAQADASAPTDLFILDVASGNLRRLTRTKEKAEGQPSWDPSGQRIVFSRGPQSFFYGEDSSSPSRIWQSNADGSCKALLFKKAVRRHRYFGSDYFAPAWQPGPGREAGRIVC